MLDQATILRLNDLRNRVVRGEFVPDAELQETLKIMAEGRRAAQEASAERRKAAKPTMVVGSGDSLLAKMAAAVAAKKETKQ